MEQSIGKGNYINHQKDGYWEYFTEDNQVAKRGNYKDGLMDGPWEFYTASIKSNRRWLHKKITFKNGVGNGLFQLFNGDVLVARCNLKDGVKNGTYESFFDDGKKETIGGYRNGFKDGEWLSFYTSGALFEKQNWNCDLCWHDSENFYESGLPMEGGRYLDRYASPYSKEVHDGKVDAKINVEYDSEAEPESNVNDILLRKSNYLGGSKDGVWEYYFKNGNLKQCGEYKGRLINDVKGKWSSSFSLYSHTELEAHEHMGKEGLWSYFHEEGILKETINYQNGIQHGEKRVYDFGGSLERIERWVKGTAQGQWEHFFTDGSISLIENYFDNILHGLCEGYFPSGAVKSRENYAGGKKNGECEYFYDNGRLERSGYWKNDFRDGTWEYFNPEGEQINIHTWNYGKENSGNFDDGNIKSNWTDGMPNGLWEIYYDNGQLCRKGHFISGRRDGLWEYYNSDGELKGKGLWKDGEKHDGCFVDYHDYCILERISNYRNGLQDGYYEEYYFGELVEKGAYKEGKRSGFFEEYAQGVLVKKGEYLNGVETGLWEFFGNDGEIKRRGSFVDGKMHGPWEIFLAGKVINALYEAGIELPFL